jgi:hypothetical protein
VTLSGGSTLMATKRSRCVAGFKHDAHPAGAELLDDLIVPKCSSDHAGSIARRNWSSRNDSEVCSRRFSRGIITVVRNVLTGSRRIPAFCFGLIVAKRFPGAGSATSSRLVASYHRPCVGGVVQKTSLNNGRLSPELAQVPNAW